MSENHKTIFIVDDEPMITGPLGRLIGRRLQKQKLDYYQIETANDPTEALETIKNLKENGLELALVIADIMMSEMNGLDFLTHVKDFYPDAPRIIITGYADKENAVKALNELDLFYYVEKPWNNELFMGLILRGLQKYRQGKIEAMFSLYVPREIIAEFVDRRRDDRFLEGTDVDATVMFLDIADFTRLSGEMDARDVVRLLNQYFTVMVDVIHKYQGILDKYTGDGLMALFGVPNSAGSAADDARNAVMAAMEIAGNVFKLNDETKKMGGPSIRIRMGLNTGNMVVGNIGSAHRVNYTAVSDVVNTASRIEDAARFIIEDDSACVLISQQTYEFVKNSLQDQVDFQPQEPIKLRGKEAEQILYKATLNSV